MKIAVSLGSSYGSDPASSQAAAELGRWIASRGHELVYGGTAMGCMESLADAVIASGGTAIGVVPQFMVDRGIMHQHLSEAIVVETMAERKTKMIELADAYIACPGGPGTLEEISEALSLAKLGKLDAPAVFFNKNGFYEPLRAQFQAMVAEGFWTEEECARVRFIGSVDELDGIIG